MINDNIRQGEYRTFVVDDESTVIIDMNTGGHSSNQLDPVLKISRMGGSMMQTENCAIILAMALNACMDINSMHQVLSEQSGEASKRATWQALHAAAAIARNGCFVPPDGGSPTSDEAEMCDRIADAILLLCEVTA